jgi:phage host-nuclease inhibitor protein Gam
MVTFDTLAYAKRLRRAGLTEEQADVHAEALATALGEVLVTKQDLHDLATKDDLHRLELVTKDEFAAIRQEMSGEFAAIRQEMNGEFAAVRQEMNGEFAAVRQEMSGEFAAVRQEMSGEFAAVRQEMRALELRMTLRVGALFSIGIGALAALLKLT